MPHETGKFTLTSKVTIQTRRAQSIDSALAAGIRRVCKANQHIVACYLLDGRKPDANEIGLIIALTLDSETDHLELAGLQFQEMLREFPVQALKTVIMSS